MRVALATLGCVDYVIGIGRVAKVEVTACRGGRLDARLSRER